MYLTEGWMSMRRDRSMSTLRYSVLQSLSSIFVLLLFRFRAVFEWTICFILLSSTEMSLFSRVIVSSFPLLSDSSWRILFSNRVASLFDSAGAAVLLSRSTLITRVLFEQLRLFLQSSDCLRLVFYHVLIYT